MKKYFFSLLLLFILDRFSKIYILKNPFPSLGGFFGLQINKDMAFSLPMTYFLLYPIIVIILILLLWFWKKDYQRKSILIWPWAMIIIGAISNLMDRVQYGGVIDFINVPYFTVFNLSDIYISIGVVWILWYEWFFKQFDKNNKRSIILVSACLAGEACRYDGKHKLNKEVFDLIKSGKAIAVCPEILAGLSIPRSPADIINGKVIEKDGNDVTGIYQKGAELAYQLYKDKNIKINKAILKVGSPSCGRDGLFSKLLQQKGVRVEHQDKT